MFLLKEVKKIMKTPQARVLISLANTRSGSKDLLVTGSKQNNKKKEQK